MDERNVFAQIQDEYDANNTDHQQMFVERDMTTPQSSVKRANSDSTPPAAKHSRLNATTPSTSIEELTELRAQKLRQDVALGQRLQYKTELQIRKLEIELGKPKSRRFSDSDSE